MTFGALLTLAIFVVLLLAWAYWPSRRGDESLEPERFAEVHAAATGGARFACDEREDRVA